MGILKSFQQMKKNIVVNEEINQFLSKVPSPVSPLPCLLLSCPFLGAAKKARASFMVDKCYKIIPFPQPHECYQLECYLKMLFGDGKVFQKLILMQGINTVKRPNASGFLYFEMIKLIESIYVKLQLLKVYLNIQFLKWTEDFL